MFISTRKFLVLVLVAAATSLAASAGYLVTQSNGWFILRDKKGTSGWQEKNHGSQVTDVSTLTSRGSFQAEGTGVEPETPYGAPVLQTGR